jgi:hypothetical protein
VTLIGANAQPIVTKREALLIVGENDFVEKLARKRVTVARGGFQQRVYRHPTGVAQGEADDVRLMSQHEAQELAYAN